MARLKTALNMAASATGWSRVLFLAATACLVALRFFHLEADFPAGLTWSAAPYTDEGWYSSGAIRHQLTGHWLMEGDFNPMVTMPVFHLAQAVTFKVLGMSLATARLTALAFFVLLLVSLFGLVRRYEGPTAAHIALLIVSASSAVFAYSRLALLDLPLTALLTLSLLLASSFPRAHWLVPAALSALAFSAAVLTKSTGIFALPVLLYLTWGQHPERGGKIRACILVFALVGAVLGGYRLATQLAFPADETYFRQVNLTPRISLAPLGLLRRIPETLSSGWKLEPLLYPVVLPLAALVWLLGRSARRHRLLTASLLWAIAFFLLLNVYVYHPERYYLPLIVPLACLSGAFLARLSRDDLARRRTRVLRLVAWSWLAVACVVNIRADLRYVRHPAFSLRDAGRDIRQAVLREAGPQAMIAGSFANTLSLVTGLPSMNDALGSRDLGWRLRRYQPACYVELIYHPQLFALLEGLGFIDDRQGRGLDMERLRDPRLRAALRARGVIVELRTLPDGREDVVVEGVSAIRARAARVRAARRPFYYMTDLVGEEILETIEASYDLAVVKSYDVFGNYFYHQVYLFRMLPRRPDAAAGMDTGASPQP